MSFTAAAKKLYMSQPKMSMHIQAIEDELGFPLFDRHGSLSLTREGALFYEHISGLLDEYDALVEQCRGLSKVVAVRFVFGEFSMIDMVPAASMARFRKALSKLAEDPRYEVVSHPLDNTLTIAESFEAGLCDASFRTCCMESFQPGEIVDLPDGMSVLPLEMDPMVALVSSHHPLAGRSSVSVQDIAAYPVPLSSLPVMATFNSTRSDFFTAHGCKPRYHVRAVSTPSALLRPDTSANEVYLVARSYGQKRDMLQLAGLEALDISDTVAQSCFCLCFPAGTSNKAVQALVQELKGDGAGNVGRATAQ